MADHIPMLRDNRVSDSGHIPQDYPVDMFSPVAYAIPGDLGVVKE